MSPGPPEEAWSWTVEREADYVEMPIAREQTCLSQPLPNRAKHWEESIWQ